MPNTFSETLTGAFEQLWFGLVQLIPAVIVALVILLVGWAIGAVLAGVIERVVNATRVNDALKNTKLNDASKRAGYRINSGKILGEIVKWFFIIVFLIAALDVLGLTQITMFLQSIVFNFLPNLLVAAVILLIGGLVAELAQNMVTGGAKSADVGNANLLGRAAGWGVWVFSIMAALTQLNIAEELVQTLFAGIVLALTLALGLAFGLGGRDKAKQYLEKADSKAKEKMRGRHS